MYMKKKYISIVASLLLLVGCANDEAITQQGAADGGVKKFTSFTATVGDVADTRAYLGDGPAENTKQVFWEEDERIIVYSDEESEGKQFNSSEIKNNTATFYGEEISGNQFYALYPEWGWEPSENNPNIVYFNLGQFGNPNNENEYRMSAPMVAKTTDNSLDFKQTTGLIHVTVGGMFFIESVWIHGNNDEKLGSRGYIDLSEEEPVFTIDENTDSFDSARGIGYNPDEAQNVDYKDIYFIIPPTTFENGFTLYISGYDEDNIWIEYSKSTSQQLVVERGSVKRFTLVDVNAELAEKAAGYDAIVASQLNAMEDQVTAQALSAFYKSLNGGYWTNIDQGWGRTDDPVEDWEGLWFENGQLRRIELPFKNLKGDIPAAIQNLTMLHELNLHGNNITSVPDELWTMNTLMSVNLNDNKLSGPLPAAAANLTGLNNLSLSGNNFEGAIPDNWFNGFGNLSALLITGNKLSDTITEADMETNMWQNLQNWQIIAQQYGYGITVPGYVSQILLNTTHITLRVGEPFQLEVTVLPEAFANVELEWNYPNDILSIDEETGTITALEPWCGTEIRIRANDGSNVEVRCHVDTKPEDYEE
jgi:hypothetical protein